MNFKDVYLTVHALQSDCLDTTSKITNFVSGFAELNDIIDSYRQLSGSQLEERWLQLVNSLNGKHIVYRNADLGLSVYSTSGPLDTGYFLEVQSAGVTCLKIALSDMDPHVGVWVNGIHSEYDIDNFDALNVVYNFGSAKSSISSVIAQMKTSVQTQSVLTMIADYVMGHSDLSALIARLQSIPEATPSTSAIIDAFLSKSSGSWQVALQWLASTYDAMSNVLYDSADNAYNFSSTDDRVYFAWSTVMNVVGSAISAAVQAVGQAIGGIVGGLFAVIGTIGGMAVGAIQQASNPLVSIDETKRLTCSVPIATSAAHSLALDSFWGPLAQLGGCTIDVGTATMRFWRAPDLGSSTDRLQYEVFTRPVLGPQWFRARYVATHGQRPFIGQGLYGLMANFNDDPDLQTGCGLVECPTEGSQAIILFMNTWLNILTIAPPTFDSAGLPQSVSDLWSWAADSSHSVASRFAAIDKIFSACWGLFASDSNIEKLWQTDVIANEFCMSFVSWEKYCNILTPLCRGSLPLISGEGPYPTGVNWSTFVEARDENMYINQGGGVFTDFSADPGSSYGIVLPRVSAQGFLVFVASAIVVTTVVATAAVATTLRAKKAMAKKQLQSALRAKTAQAKYEAALSGVDYTDPTGETPRDYTRAEKNALFKDYWKSAKAYNRWSFMWGGGTWSFVNGWADAEDGETAGDAGSLLSTFYNSQLAGSPVQSATIEDVLKLINPNF